MLLKIIIYILLILFISYINKYLTNLNKTLSSEIENLEIKRKNILINGVASLYENKLISKDSSGLILWCESYLKTLGYENIYYEKDGSENILCCKNNIKYFVKCVHKEESSTESKTDNILLYQLVGEMINKKITYGIILSPGSFTDEWKNIFMKFKETFNLSYHDKEVILDNCLKYKIRL